MDEQKIDTTPVGMDDLGAEFESFKLHSEQLAETDNESKIEKDQDQEFMTSIEELDAQIKKLKLRCAKRAELIAQLQRFRLEKEARDKMQDLRNGQTETEQAENDIANFLSSSLNDLSDGDSEQSEHEEKGMKENIQ